MERHKSVLCALGEQTTGVGSTSCPVDTP